jgi:hypothetical protein
MPDDTDRDDAPSYVLSAWLYPRVLALVAAIAFVSIWIQLEGLFGDGGLAPLSDLFAALDTRGVSFFDRPTLAWFSPTSETLALFAAAGVFASTTLFLGVFPRLSVASMWVLYLSIVNAGFPFTAFQWDTLLVEVLFASMLYVGAERIDRRSPDEPHPMARWVLWLLLFRLMFRSGVVKLASGDPTWANLTALEHHYETQPLPTLFGWYAHQLPPFVQRASAFVMFFIELVLPFLIFVPRRAARRTAVSGFALLMILIVLTGNYGFFNLLTLALCLTLMDDRALRRMLPRGLVAFVDGRSLCPDRAPWEGRVRTVLSVVLIGAASLGLVSGLLRFDGDPIAPLRPLRSLNDYGLFAVMTTDRPEIEIEGSHDGETWRAYRFRYKVGRMDRAPVWNTPHQPRLDWQMWFAALGEHRHNPFVSRLMARLAARDPSVLELVERDPFHGEPPPRFVRARRFQYRMTDWAERSAAGHYFHREPMGLYAPVLRVE